MDTVQVQCVGFIMDGNRRWAKAHGLPALQGHTKGYERFQEAIKFVHRAGIPHMVCYAFSTENWKRAEEEVGYLMKLFERALTELVEKSISKTKEINIRVIGEKERFSPTLQKHIEKVEAENLENPKLTVWVALSYGGRAEIVHAVNCAIREGREVDESTFEKMLWSKGMPDPDLIIRTSGEQRTSNFLLWQSAYSELFFTDTFWPDFGETEFQSILKDYATRQRRKGT
jgi:undecaprenyl diphosphate synthase